MKYVRELEPRDFDEQSEVICVGFPWNTPQTIHDRLKLLCEHSYSFGSFEEDRLVSQIIATPYTLDFFNTYIPMAGIGFVATLPDFQGQHRIDDLMKAILKKMDEENFVLSYLAPFSYRFYRRFGYERIFNSIDYIGPLAALPSKEAKTIEVKAMDWEKARPFVHEIAKEDADLSRAQILREDWWEEYKFHLRKDYSFCIAFEEGRPVGYLAYTMKDDQIDLFEIKSENEEVLLALLESVKKLDRPAFHYLETQGQSELFDLCEDEVTIDKKLLPGMMARVIDVEKFLKMYPYRKPLYCAIEITEDAYCPWNVGLYEIQGNKVKKVHETTEPIVSMSENEFVQLVFDFYAFMQKHPDLAVKNGTIDTIKEKLEASLIQEPVLFADYF